jgi:hypothetical protein
MKPVPRQSLLFRRFNWPFIFASMSTAHHVFHFGFISRSHIVVFLLIFACEMFMLLMPCKNPVVLCLWDVSRMFMLGLGS